jgi:ABC-type glycerol-3-phosphate transport system substrate-binding protein
MKTRLTALLLAAAMLLPLTACSGKPDDPAPGSTAVTDPAVSGTETAVPAPEETAYIAHADPPGVEKMDFDGEEFHSGVHQNYPRLHFRDEETGDVFNDALYDRMRKTEEYLNVRWTYQVADYQQVTEAVLSGDDIYQHILNHTLTGNNVYVQNGYLYRIDDIPYIDLDAEWWDREQMDILRLGKYYYFMISDFTLDTPYAIFVNCDLIERYNMEDPYQLVYEGKWTLDRFASMCEEVAHDANGNGTWDDDDVMGVTTGDTSHWSGFMTGCGQTLTQRDKYGDLELALNSEKMQNIVEKMTALAKTPGAVCKYWESERRWEDGSTLFFLGALDMMRDAGEYEFTMGLVPYPKYDEAQDRYYSLNWNATACVPSSIRNPALVGAVLEYASWETANQVTPAYYDITLGTRYAKDPATRDMLAYILENSVLDAGAVYFGMSGLLDQLYIIGYLCIYHQSTDLQSYIATSQKYFKTSLNDLYNGMDAVEEN